MNPAEIVKKVLLQHRWSMTRFECWCGWKSEVFGQKDYMPHVAEEIVGALGNQLAPDGFVVSHCAHRGEPILVPRTDPTNEAMLLCDPCNAALIRDAQAATTPQARVTGAGVGFAQGGQLPPTPRDADVTTAWLSGGEVAP